jgi:hypothetical protein
VLALLFLSRGFNYGFEAGRLFKKCGYLKHLFVVLVAL